MKLTLPILPTLGDVLDMRVVLFSSMQYSLCAMKKRIRKSKRKVEWTDQAQTTSRGRLVLIYLT